MMGEYDPFNPDNYVQHYEYEGVVIDEEVVKFTTKKDGTPLDTPILSYVLTLKKDDGSVVQERWRIDINANRSQKNEWHQALQGFKRIGILPQSGVKKLVGQRIKFRRLKSKKLAPILDASGNQVIENGKKKWQEIDTGFYYAVPVSKSTPQSTTSAVTTPSVVTQPTTSTTTVVSNPSTPTASSTPTAPSAPQPQINASVKVVNIIDPEEYTNDFIYPVEKKVFVDFFKNKGMSLEHLRNFLTKVDKGETVYQFTDDKTKLVLKKQQPHSTPEDDIIF